jgi:WD40 repeat protein
VSNLAFRPDGRLVFESPPHWSLYEPSTDEMTDLDFKPGWNARVSPNGLRAVAVNANVRTWALPADGPARDELTQTGATVIRAAFSADGAAVATVEFRNRALVLVVRDATTGQEHHAFDVSNFVQPVFSVGGEYLFTWAGSALVCWGLADPKKSRAAYNPTAKPFVAVVPHPSGALLTVDDDRLVRVWDVPALKPYREIKWDVGKLHAVAVSPDGARAAVGSHTGKVLVWDWD